MRQTDEISFCRSLHNISDTKTGLTDPYETLHKSIFRENFFSEFFGTLLAKDRFFLAKISIFCIQYFVRIS